MTHRYEDLLEPLRVAYDGGAAQRDREDKPAWKLAERAAFLERLRAEGRTRLLEIGAGTGQDALFFKENGLDVVATDLSSEMVARCRAKGLDARVMDFLHLDFPAACFEAVHAVNCLLHVPNADLPRVLVTIRELLEPRGLFFLGVYGGEASEGPATNDNHVPPRFFAWRTDDQIQEFVRPVFEIVDFHVLDEPHFQSLTLRRSR